MIMVTSELVPVVYILLVLSSAFVDPQIVGVFLFDYGRWAKVGNELLLTCTSLVLKILPFSVLVVASLLM